MFSAFLVYHIIRLNHEVKMRFLLLVFALAGLFTGVFALATPTLHLDVTDRPNDDGTALKVHFQASGDADSMRVERTDGTIVFRAPFDTIAHELVDEGGLVTGKPTAYILSLRDSLNQVVAETRVEGTPLAQWYNRTKTPLLVLVLFLGLAIMYYTFTARRGKDLYIRRINGLDAMNEAVGRATEMGKSILYVPGIGDMDDIQTVAALTLLSHLAQQAAEHDTELLVPVSHSMVLSTAREILREAYLKAGRPDAFKPDAAFYLTDDQFGYVAGVDGIIIREHPAAIFLMGSFYAESLILAETGFASGAIQTAGTAQQHQLPFLVVACDYTLIGEELFAASAYLSRDPQQLGSLKGQDLGKALIAVVIIAGIILEICNVHTLSAFFNH
jgi:hypothetical protein